MRRTGLYSLVALVSLVLVGALVVGAGRLLDDGGDSLAAQNSAPATAERPATTPERTEEKTGTDEPEATEKEGELRPEVQDGWRDRAAEARAAEQRAAERRAAEQRAAGQETAVRTAAPTSAPLNLTVPKMGLYNDPVANSIAESVLANGAGKLPSTGFPWQAGSNTYIAAHVYGYPGTGSWQQFANLPSMTMGDVIYLTGSDGTTYEYRVDEILTVAPTDVWVTEPTGETTVSLQTCVGPGWSERLIVRGTLVGTSQA